MRMLTALAFATVVAAAPASAALVNVTYSGTVTKFNRVGSGWFGGNDLLGSTYVASILFDTAGKVSVDDGTNFGEYVEGGQFFGTASPALAASLTINGQTVKSGLGNYWGAASAINAGPTTDLNHLHFVKTNNGVTALSSYLDFYVSGPGNIIPAGIESWIDYGAWTWDSAYGYFFYSRTDVKSDAVDSIQGEFSVDWLTVAPGAPVPEPSSWALMIAGFTLVGRAMRRRVVSVAA